MLRIVIKPRYGRLVRTTEGPFSWDECFKRQMRTWSDDFRPDIHASIVAIPIQIKGNA